MRFLAIWPLVCYIVSLVLTFLCLFAGHKTGFMEDYDLVRLNTSALGYNLVDNTFSFGGNGSDSSDDDGGGVIGSLISDAKHKLDEAEDKIKALLNAVGNEVAAELSQQLGIHQWYSIHILSTCEGGFEPNATSPNPRLNTTSCFGGALGNNVNITGILDHELSIGPAQISLADLNFPTQDVQHAVAKVNDLLHAIAVIYIIAIAAAGLGMLLTAGTIATSEPHLVLAIISLAVAALAQLMLLIASALATAGARKAATEITDHGAIVGLSATSGRKFIITTWIALGFVWVAGWYHVIDLWRTTLGRKSTVREKTRYGGR